MTDLSHAAQAVLDAYQLAPIEDELTAAAVLRAAADQAHPKAHIEDIDYVHQSYVHGWKDALDVILAIAAELEGQ
jgi:propanediol dehydratase large subunit